MTSKTSVVRCYLRSLKALLVNWIGHVPSHRIRRLLYEMAGMKLGRRSIIYGGAEVRHARMITIGDGSIVGNGAILDGRLGITIGRNVNFSTGVWIWTVQHDYRCPDFGDQGGSVTIGDYAWISCRSVILPGVSIGEGAVVSAGAVVTKDVPPYAVVGGVPARVLGERPRGLRYDLSAGQYIHFL